jgi:PTH1 family peptidyl-tRNA hydrolase
MDINIIVGLGNPGPTYGNTRHNIGFRVVERLAARAGLSWTEATTYDHASGIIADTAAVLIRPRTFMNRSADAVVRALVAWETSVSSLLVVVDDIDLPLGRIRLRPSGGPGTHNGLRDITDAVGDGFARLRVGVRDSEIGNDLADYVLESFDPRSLATLDSVIDLAADAVLGAVSDGVAAAMNQFNGQRIDRPPAEDGEP